jgi:hypothetical protein
MSRRVAFWAAVLAFVVLTVVPNVTASTAPTLSILDRQPLELRGRGFYSGELVRVTVRTDAVFARSVRARASGAFTVTFAAVDVPRCGGVFATARGRAGSFARLKIPLPACLPATQP